MERATLALVAGLLVPDIAQAQNVEPVQVGVWTIYSTSTSCYAINRDPEEFNSSPYNGLVLRQAFGAEDILLLAHFWPKAFATGDEVILKLLIADKRISVAAVARDTYQLATVEPLSPRQLDDLAKTRLMSATVDDLLAAITFKMEDFGAALTALSDCAKGQ
jgi:hypothetical protein